MTKTIAAILAAVLAMSSQPAEATARQCEPAQDSYDCLIIAEYRNGWRNVTSLTYCYPRSDWTMTYSNGEKTYGSPLPAAYRSYVDAAANVWSDTPGLRVSLVPAACSSRTDIRVYGFHGRAKDAAGEAGCFADGKRYCRAGSGFVFLSVDDPADDKHAKALLHASIHEFGHVLGLDHPCDHLCGGPVMSYGSCRNTEDCSTLPDYNDVVGLQLVYGWPDTSGGCEVSGHLVRAGSPPVQVNLSDLTDRLGSLNHLLDDRPTVAGALPPARRWLPPAADGGDVVAGAANLVARLADQRVDAYGTLDAMGGSLARGVYWLAGEIGAGGAVPALPDPVRCVAG